MPTETTNCYTCAHFSELKKPRQIDEFTSVYGYCFKDLSEGREGYSVYLPNGYCKKHLKNPSKENDNE